MKNISYISLRQSNKDNILYFPTYTAIIALHRKIELMPFPKNFLYFSYVLFSTWGYSYSILDKTILSFNHSLWNILSRHLQQEDYTYHVGNITLEYTHVQLDRLGILLHHHTSSYPDIITYTESDEQLYIISH